MTDQQRLTELLKEIQRSPEKTCPRGTQNELCEGCPYDRGNNCDMEARTAAYLIKNGVCFRLVIKKTRRAENEE